MTYQLQKSMTRVFTPDEEREIYAFLEENDEMRLNEVAEHFEKKWQMSVTVTALARIAMFGPNKE